MRNSLKEEQSFPIDKLTPQEQKNLFRKLQIIPTLFISKGQGVVKNSAQDSYDYLEDPFVLADKFSINSDMLIVDIDEYKGDGNNREIIKKIAMKYKCYVSNGSSDQEVLNDFLNSNVKRIVIYQKN